jgi:hypothetical protein
VSTETLTITDFLLARIAEDEAVAQVAAGPNWTTGAMGDKPHMIHKRRHDPVRVLAECKAKRAIVADLGGLIEYDRDKFIVSPQVESVASRTLQRMGAPYADHPDFDPAWS